MTEWKTYRLGDICDLVAGFAFKSKDFGGYSNKVVKIADIQPPVVNTNELVGVDLSNYDTVKLSKYLVSKGDYVLAMTGATIGKLGRITNDIEAYINQRVLTFRPIESIVNKDYLYYQLCSDKFNKFILNHIDSETAQPNISAGSVGGFEISLPSLEEQRRIAGILGAIDDKIENNRRINTNLELQVQALYKQWFVDNRKEDWERKPLSEIAEFIGGYSYKGNELVEASSTAMATIKNFERKGGFKVEGFKDIVASPKLKAEQHAELFDILVAHTDLTQNADVIGNAEILLTFGKYSDIIFSMDLVKVLPKCNFPYKYLLAALLKNPYFKAHCLGYVNGTTVLHMSKKALPEYVVACPSNSEAEKMDGAFKAYYQKMAEILQENEALSTFRDILLPKLMSGEIKL